MECISDRYDRFRASDGTQFYGFGSRRSAANDRPNDGFPNSDLKTEAFYRSVESTNGASFHRCEVEDLERVLQELSSQQNEERELEIFLLDGDRDGIEQIAEILSGFQDIDAVHLFSHGKDGNVKLGNTWLNNENLSPMLRT